MNFPVSSEHSCTEVCARTTVRKSTGCQQPARGGQGFYYSFSQKTKQQITPGNMKWAGIRTLTPFQLMLKHPTLLQVII